MTARLRSTSGTDNTQ